MKYNLLTKENFSRLAGGGRFFVIFDQGLLNLYGFIYILLIVRPFPKDELGILMIAESIKILTFALVDGCWSQALIKFLSGADDEEKGDILTTSLILKVFALSAASILLIILASPIALLMKAQALAKLIWLIPLLVAGKIIYNTSRAILISRQEYRMLFFYHLLYAIIFLGSLITGLLFFQLDKALEVMIVFLITNFACSILAFPFLQGKWSWGKFDKIWAKRIYSFSRSAFINTTGSWLYWKTDILMIGAMINPAFTAIYSISSHFIKAFTLLFEAFHLILYPVVSKIAQNLIVIPDESKTKIKYIYKNAGFLLQGIVIVLAGFFFVFAEQVVVILFSEKYIETVPVLRILIVGIAATPFSRLGGSVLNGIGKPHIAAVITWSIGICNVILNFILIPKLGMAGAAISSSFSMIIMTILYLVIIQKQMRID